MIYLNFYTTEYFISIQGKSKEVSDDVSESNDIGENEDADVKAERQKVCNIMDSHLPDCPVVMVHVRKIALKI